MYVQRSIKERFASASRLNSVVAIVGPRQSGKTTFLKKQAGGTAAYVLFDDPDVKSIFDDDIKKFENQYIRKGRPIILDEVQYANDPGSKLKYLADTGNKLWVTSSSEVVLRKEVLGWLAGRVGILTLYQFSFQEFLAGKGQKETTDKITRRMQEEHMKYGGYPKVVLEEDQENKETLLRDLYETVVIKDVARMFNIDDIAAIERTATYLSRCMGNVLVYNNICRDLGLSFQTLKKYLDAMEKSYIIRRLEPFYKNKLNEIIKQPKLYFLDTGLRNSIANDFNMNGETKGKIFENYVFTELLKAGMKIRFWQSKSKAEVDFVVQRGSDVIPIEVKFDGRGAHVERSLKSFIGGYKPKLGFVVFMDGEPFEVRIGSCMVRFVTVPALISQLEGLVKAGRSATISNRKSNSVNCT